MKKPLHSRDSASKGAALIIVLGLVVIATALGLAYFTRATTDRQLAQSSYNDTSADLLARTAFDITVSDLKQEIVTNQPVNTGNIQPARYPAPIPTDNPNLIRYSSHNDARSRASSVISTAASANGRSISLARWNSHYLIPPVNATGTDSTPVASFVPPDWVLVTAQGPDTAPAPNAVIGRYAFAVYDEGGLIAMNVGGFPTYAGLTLPTLPGRPALPTRRMAPKYPSEESEIMLAAFTLNAPCQKPKFTPQQTNATLPMGVPCSVLFNTNGDMPQTFTSTALPHGLSINTTNGNITGVPTDIGPVDVTVTATNACGSGNGLVHFNVQGFPAPDTTPWPVNLARKGTLAFADLTALPSTPTAITPTTLVGSMGGFLGSTSINKLMGWRNYATTKQPGAFFPNSNPWFPPGPPDDPTKDLYARYFLGEEPPFTRPFTAVSATVQNGRTDQALMTRQELIRLQRTLNNPPGQFPQSLLQYLGTFSREHNQPAPDWPQLGGGKLSGRWDMNNLQLMIPDSWLAPGYHGQGHAYGKQRHSEIGQMFGLVWVSGTFAPGTRFTNPNYYGHWRYFNNISQLPDNPDFFQIINYAMKQGNPNVTAAQVFSVGAALIDLYDTDDLVDPDPNPPVNGNNGNPITIIDYGGASYAYGIEGISFDDPAVNSLRPPFAPNPLSLGVPANYVLLNRRFENVGEFGYAYNPASTLASKTLDFASSASNDKALLDFFTYSAADVREGTVNLNTRNGPVLASIIRGALLHDLGSENQPTSLVFQTEALAAGQAIVQETTSTAAGRGPVLNRGDVARLAAAATNKLIADGLWSPPVSDEKMQTIARALAETGQARTWNLMIDVIAQTGNYAPGTPDLSDPSKFIVQGEKRYWLHIALDRDDGTVLGSQLEEVVE
jgi:putative Ig domain-containing protein